MVSYYDYNRKAPKTPRAVSLSLFKSRGTIPGQGLLAAFTLFGYNAWDVPFPQGQT